MLFRNMKLNEEIAIRIKSGLKGDESRKGIILFLEIWFFPESG